MTELLSETRTLFSPQSNQKTRLCVGGFLEEKAKQLCI